tara:strand:+ start:898 stop:1206 length:309 start_codon:yes stop_codon:yes gene_type:complete
MTTLDGTKIEEFALNVAEYLQRQAIAKEAEKRLNETKDALKSYMALEGLSEAEVGEHIVKLIDISRETVDTKVAKVVIPKKYLAEILKTTKYQQLRIDHKKD